MYFKNIENHKMHVSCLCSTQCKYFKCFEIPPQEELPAGGFRGTHAHKVHLKSFLSTQNSAKGIHNLDKPDLRVCACAAFFSGEKYVS